jgi:hypothetical protein
VKGGEEKMETNNPVVPQPAAAPVAPEPVAQPAPVSDRTANEFAKLLESNKRLAEQNEVYRKSIELLNTQPVAPRVPVAPVATAPAPTPTGSFNVNDFVETDASGEKVINEQKLAAYYSDLAQKASKVDNLENQLNTFVKSQNEQQMMRETNEAIEAFPELDPKAQNFDVEFLRDVRARITDSMINPQDYNLPAGQRLGYKQAASLVKQQYSRFGVAVTKQATQQQEAEAQAVVDAKAQAAAPTPTSSTPVNAYTVNADAELQSLRMKTRMGSDEALAKRLLHTEHIMPKDGSGGTGNT